jgi:hypothetical protein
MAYTRNFKEKRSEQSISGSKCKQQARSTSMTDIPENIISAVRQESGVQNIVKVVCQRSEVLKPEVRMSH